MQGFCALVSEALARRGCPKGAIKCALGANREPIDRYNRIADAYARRCAQLAAEELAPMTDQEQADEAGKRG